ncbi:MAG: polyphosphate polymerase domain-containing protein [Proteobacteria bacterium]|nr:polyphosphate polymerase domain-containing protein [Pseudomonadota bacterium]NOG60121.1 polyphosphate polymerase domain-containing protein [Pseudomonadota bacterium]
MQSKRHELKFYLNEIQSERSIHQLNSLMDVDAYCKNQQSYRVRSLYFDSYDDECLYEKQSGNLLRKKIRLRTYDGGGNEPVKFEIKRKQGQIVKKDVAIITKEEAEQVCLGNFSVLLNKNNAVLNEIYTTFVTKLYKPKVIVEYNRTAFVLPVSNIRVTLDQDLSSNINHLDLFSPVNSMMPVILEGKQILEIKYDDFFPGYLKKVLSSLSSERMAISKYTLARRFHKVHKWEDN